MLANNDSEITEGLKYPKNKSSCHLHSTSQFVFEQCDVALFSVIAFQYQGTSTLAALKLPARRYASALLA